MLDRTVPPIAGPLTLRPLPRFETTSLSNGIPVYLLPYGMVEMVEVQVVFRAGKALQDHIGQAAYAARILSEGTASFDSQALGERLDEHGAWISHDVGFEFASLNLTTLIADLPETLPLLSEVILTPSFPEAEFDKLKKRNIQQLQVQEEKTTTLAKRAFGYALYGENHPYGRMMTPVHMESLTLESLRTYHQEVLHFGNAFITVTGKFDRIEMLKVLEDNWGHVSLRAPSTRQSDAGQTAEMDLGYRHIERAGPQSTVRVGHIGTPRKHPDYYGLELLTTALGGYFGSRLMKNIREDKGYTYGIYAGWAAYREAGHFVIQADVANEYVEDTLVQIKTEMRRLQDAPLNPDELALVKNYMLGKALRSRETPFQLSEILRYSQVSGIPFTEMDRAFEVVQNISADELQRLAQKHFHPDNLLEVVVGGKID